MAETICSEIVSCTERNFAEEPFLFLVPGNSDQASQYEFVLKKFPHGSFLEYTLLYIHICLVKELNHKLGKNENLLINLGKCSVKFLFEIV